MHGLPILFLAIMGEVKDMMSSNIYVYISVKIVMLESTCVQTVLVFTENMYVVTGNINTIRTSMYIK